MIRRLSRVAEYWRRNGTMRLAGLVARKLGGVLQGRPLFNPLPPDDGPARVEWVETSQATSPVQVADRRFVNLRPLKTFRVPASSRRLTMVTDSVAKGSLFGGVGTALLLSALLARRMGARLRVVTRTEKPVPGNVAEVLSVYGIALDQETEFAFAAVDDRAAEIDVQDEELFLTTSWWTTHATLAGVPASQVVYLLQEDERMFYPYGDDRLLCERLLQRDDLRYVINTQLLYQHLVDTGLPHLQDRAAWFEPAFPSSVFHPRARPQGGRRRFFFYARPNNLRNLFFLGLRVIDRALAVGVLDPREWEIVLVGNAIPRLDLGPDVKVEVHENLAWAEYAQLCGGIDLALSLMYTPHPSYPPLDLAASGAVVVTNQFGIKRDLGRYSANILCAQADVDSLVEGLRAGVELARSPARQANHAAAGLQRDWVRTLSPVVEALVH